MTPPLVWFLCGLVLVLLALLGVDSDGLLLMAGVGSLLLTLVTGLVPLPFWLALLLFVVLGGSGYGLLRRWDGSQRDRSLPPTPSSDRAEVIRDFDGAGRGRVRWQGQSWAAVNLEPQRPLAAGAEVIVMGRDGTHLQVLPR